MLSLRGTVVAAGANSIGLNHPYVCVCVFVCSPPAAGETNIGLALQTAQDLLLRSNSSQCAKAIVVLTDGIPTVGLLQYVMRGGRRKTRSRLCVGGGTYVCLVCVMCGGTYVCCACVWRRSLPSAYNHTSIRVFTYATTSTMDLMHQLACQSGAIFDPLSPRDGTFVPGVASLFPALAAYTNRTNVLHWAVRGDRAIVAKPYYANSMYGPFAGGYCSCCVCLWFLPVCLHGTDCGWLLFA